MSPIDLKPREIGVIHVFNQIKVSLQVSFQCGKVNDDWKALDCSCVPWSNDN